MESTWSLGGSVGECQIQAVVPILLRDNAHPAMTAPSLARYDQNSMTQFCKSCAAQPALLLSAQNDGESPHRTTCLIFHITALDVDHIQ